MEIDQYLNHIPLVLIAYLLGSIPTSVWIGKWFYNKDVRDYGSGNAGATNTIRVLGLKAGLPALVIDVLKGFAAVSLIHFLKKYQPDTNDYITFQIILGMLAVLGHIFPIFAEFRGGKGVATMLGIVIAIAPMPSLIGISVFTITLIITKYVSIGSILAGLSFPISVLFIFNNEQISLITFSILVFVLLVITHRKNIYRLIKGEENKADFLKKNKNNL